MKLFFEKFAFFKNWVIFPRLIDSPAAAYVYFQGVYSRNLKVRATQKSNQVVESSNRSGSITRTVTASRPCIRRR